jgi:DNA-binding response OmpR family regulator
VTRALVIGDLEEIRSEIVARLRALHEFDGIARADGRTSVEVVARAMRPQYAFVDEMRWPGLALARIAELRRADAGMAIIGLSRHASVPWSVEGLRAGADAVVPRRLSDEMLARVMQEVAAAGGPTIEWRSRRVAA